MNLPYHNKLPVNVLAACFNNTSATYKFYWFLSIIQFVENGSSSILKRDLFAKMISNAWYTVNYFHVSFGSQDLIQQAIRKLKDIEGFTIDEKQETVFIRLAFSTKSETQRQLWHFNGNVPHWFLSPWFPKFERETDSKREKRIYTESKKYNNKSLYSLFEDSISINPDWIKYISANAKVLKDFCYWNLALFLQSKNPNVPDIPNKLIKPAIRNTLTTQRKNYWDIVLKELGSIDCIYTNNKLTVGNYAVEHFIPYNFVSHNLIWNLIPAHKNFNSRKSDRLPQLDKYFDRFFDLQKKGIEIVKRKNPQSKLLQDYLTIFPDIDKSISKERFKERIEPLVIIASNNGFEFL